MVDYRKLLIKYINHVADNCGSSFISDKGNYGFTDEESKELNTLDDEAIEILNSANN